MALNIQSTNQQAAAKAIQKTIDGLNIPAADKQKLAEQVAKLAKSPDVIDKILRTSLAGSGAAGGMLGETLVAAGIGTSLFVGSTKMAQEIGNNLTAIKDNFAGVKDASDAAKAVWDSVPQAAFAAGGAGVIAILGIVAFKAGVEYKDMVKAEWSSRMSRTNE